MGTTRLLDRRFQIAPPNVDVDTGQLRIPGAGLGFNPVLYKWASVIARVIACQDRPPLSAAEVTNAAIAFSFCAGVGLSVVDTMTGSEVITGVRIRGLSLRTLVIAKAKIATACGGEDLSAGSAARIVDECARKVGVAIIVSALRTRSRGVPTANLVPLGLRGRI
jgi:hypothetical protein